MAGRCGVSYHVCSCDRKYENIWAQVSKSSAGEPKCLTSRKPFRNGGPREECWLFRGAAKVPRDCHAERGGEVVQGAQEVQNLMTRRRQLEQAQCQVSEGIREDWGRGGVVIHGGAQATKRGAVAVSPGIEPLSTAA